MRKPVQLRSARTLKRYERLLKEAKLLAPRSKFVKGCRKFYKLHGYLTRKQVTALERVDAATNYDAFRWLDDHEFGDEDDGLTMGDFC